MYRKINQQKFMPSLAITVQKEQTHNLSDSCFSPTRYFQAKIEFSSQMYNRMEEPIQRKRKLTSTPVQTDQFPTRNPDF